MQVCGSQHLVILARLNGNGSVEVIRLNRILRMCLNWKVLGGLAVVGLVIWVLAPELLARAVPVLIFAVCPLSMLMMMRGMQDSEHGAGRPHAAASSGSGGRIAELKDQLARVQAQQVAIVREIEQLQRRSVNQGAIDAEAREVPDTVD
jgi:hypothetical protein